MFVRLLFLLLLALNIGVTAWLFLVPQPQARAFAPTDPGVAELVLLSERDRGSEHERKHPGGSRWADFHRLAPIPWRLAGLTQQDSLPCVAPPWTDP